MTGILYLKKTVSLNKFILQLQLSSELSQIQEILSTYNELLLFFVERGFFLENVSSETQSLKTTHLPIESSLSTQDPARDGINWWNYCNGNPLKFIDWTGLSVDEEGHSTSTIKVVQRFENMFNGFGFRTSQNIKDYNNSEIGQFVKNGIEELKKTEWSETKTGQKVMQGLEDAYKKGRIHFKSGSDGLQTGWGFFAHMYIGKEAVNEYNRGKSKSAVTILAHEGSHYTYATRKGIFSLWWLQYEVEGYRISDIVNIELTGLTWEHKNGVNEPEDLKKWLQDETNKTYNWIPWYPFEFNYWNKEDIGQ